MELHDALVQIGEIRRQIARSTVFRGYRSVPVAFSGFLALVAAACQPWVAPRPMADPLPYLLLWSGVALLSMTAAGVEIAGRYVRSTTDLERDTTRLALGQFLPAIVAGGLVTAALGRTAPEVVWVLPGLWAVLFGLGVFASYRLLPRSTFWVGVYYLAAGAFCLTWAQDEHALSPWTMGVSFGGGQLLTAAILYWTLERNDERQRHA